MSRIILELESLTEEHAEVWTAEDRMKVCLPRTHGVSRVQPDLTHVWFICRLDHACWNDLLGWILLLLEISLPSSERHTTENWGQGIIAWGGVQTAFSSQSPKQLQQLGNKTLLALSLNQSLHSSKVSKWTSFTIDVSLLDTIIIKARFTCNFKEI